VKPKLSRELIFIATHIELFPQVGLIMETTPSSIVTVDAAAGQSFRVYYYNNNCYVPLNNLHTSLGYSDGGFRGFLSKHSVLSTANNELKSAIGLTGKARFLSRDSIETVLRHRIKDNATLTAAITTIGAPEEDDGFVQMEIEEDNAVVITAPLETEVVPNPLEQVVAPPPLAPPPVVVRKLLYGQLVPVLSLPAGSEWTKSDQFDCGKTFILPKFERGEHLQQQLRDLRDYWVTEQHSSRGGDAISIVTYENARSDW
jgi:hypothetical protein